MTNDEAKELYQQALQAHRAEAFAQALERLDTLDQARPNSRNVTWLRGMCLAALGRVTDAEAAARWLEDKLEGEKLAELRSAIATAKAKAISQAESHTMVAEDVAEGDSAFRVESAYPADTDHATVTGYVEQGVLRVGEAVLVHGPGGIQVLAPIIRIGPADTPLNLIRSGQKGVLLLAVEPQYVVPGACLTASPEVTPAGGATMMMDMEGGAMATMLEGTDAPEVMEAERYLKQGNFDAAHKTLSAVTARDSEHAAANRLLARIHLESEAHREPYKALDHARRAYNKGGARDGAVTAVLAEALAATGEAGQGLRYLERLHTATSEPAARTALAQRIGVYRERHGIGHVYEFADAYGDVLFQSGDVQEILRALERGIITKDGKCRRDRIGEWRTMEEVLGPVYPEIGALFQHHGEGAVGKTRLLFVVAFLAAALGAFAVVVFGS